MQKILATIKGVAPLLMHAPTGLKRSETTVRGTKIHDPDVEAEQALYKSANGTIFIPASAILGTLREASKDRKVPGKGKKSFKEYIMGGLTIQPEEIPLTSPNGYAVDIRPVVVQRARILRARPRFDIWSLDFEIQIIDDVYLKPEIIKGILEDAGKYKGLLDFRPQFGRFEVTGFVVNDG